jgi:hypothetical protein
MKSIQTQITREKLVRTLESFERGETCSFVQVVLWNIEENRALVKEGVLVTQQGLKYKRRFLPWEDAASIEVKEKKIIIAPRKGSSSFGISLSIDQIANAEVLIELVSYILKQRNRR